MARQKSNSILPFIIIGAVVWYFFVKDDYVETPAEGAAAPIANTPFHSYAEKGLANSWPEIEMGFSDVSENLTAKNYYLVIDASGSMADVGCSDGKPKLSVAKDALSTFIQKIPQDSNLGIYVFDESNMSERLPLGKNNFRRAQDIIRGLRAGGGTPLNYGVQAGYQALTAQAKKQLGYGDYTLVIVTDGEANQGYEPDLQVRELLENSAITLHTVGFCINEDHSLNQPGYTLYKAADNPAALMAGLDEVLAEAPEFDVNSFNGNTQ